ncbi:MAG: mannose-1-phosphate guanylyltransferase [Marinilabiliales bacterium]
MDKNVYCVIMAGGVGSRFWPLSKTSKPKQFIDILGTGKSLLQETFERIKKICLVENILIVTNKDYKDLVKEQLPEIIENNILLEPYRRNTAPCIEYANFKILQRNKNAKIIVSPADHIVLKEDKFIKTINKALKFIEENRGLVTIGIKPNRPETGYGYIQLDKDNLSNTCKDICKVKTFTEKPDIDMAKFFLESGEFYWNSGLFIWNVNTIIEAFEKYLPDIDALFKEGREIYDTTEEFGFIEKTYSKCLNISIDYGIMEKADNVYAICSDFGWSDLGTWGSLFENSKKDSYNNAVFNNSNLMLYNTEDCIINFQGDKLIVIEGLQDYILVESENALLICRKSQEQNLRQIVNDIKLRKGEDYI